jgi:hypothetical protein
MDLFWAGMVIGFLCGALLTITVLLILASQDD